MQPPPKPCEVCDKRPVKDGCSHVDCPFRRPVTAQPHPDIENRTPFVRARLFDD